jgi:hypothetical protein
MSQPNLIKLPKIAIKPTPNNHLKRSGVRPYTVRFTVDQGKKFVGKRVSITLGSKDIKMCEWVASTTILGLEKAEFILSKIKFGRPEQDFNNLALHDNINTIIVNLQNQGDHDMANTLQDAVDNSK